MNEFAVTQKTDATPLFADPQTGPIFLGEPASPGRVAPWPVLVVDDDASVHSVTRLSLRGLTVASRPVEILEARSGVEARVVLERRPDIALLLVDVVMETDDAGLLLVDYVRETLNNHTMRIVLSTGQPGVAPEETVMAERDVNGYLSKADLSARRLRTAVVGAIRSFHDVMVIQRQSTIMETVARMQGRFIENEAPSRVAEAMLQDLLAAFSGAAGMLLTRSTRRARLHVLASTFQDDSELEAAEQLAGIDLALSAVEASGNLKLRATSSDPADTRLPWACAETWLMPLHVGNRLMGAAWLAVPAQPTTTPDAAIATLAQAAGSLLLALENAQLRKVAEQGREEAHRWLQSITANLPDGVLVEEAAGQIRLVNERFCKIFEIPAEPEALVGLGCKMAATAAAERFEDAASFVPRVDEIVAAQMPVVGELLPMLDGRWFERDFVPFSVNGQSAFLWRYHDITDIKRAQEALQVSESRYVSLFHAASDAIVLLDETGGFVDANEGAHKLLRCGQRRLIGMKLRDLFVQRDGPGFLSLSQLVVGESAAFEDELQCLDGQRFPADVLANAVLVEGRRLVQVVVRDATQRRREQTALVAAKDAAEAANAAKSKFLAVMSHEIRTPINAILGSSELLGASDLRRSQRELAAIVHNGSEILMSLINDLLDFSKIESGQMELEAGTFDLASALENVLDIVRVRALARGLTVHCEIDGRLPTRVIGDANRIRQIAMNLLSNAIKFTEVGEVSMTLRVTERDAAYVCFDLVVTDTGIGIEPSRTGSVFDSFTQGDSGIARRFGGSGLGLSIVRSLVQLMGGDISLDSVPKVGTTMTVRLTLPVPPDVPSVGPWPSGSLPVGQALVIMEPSRLRENVVRIFSDWGMTVTTAGNAAETLDRLASAEPSYRLVLVDEALPDMDGAEVVTAVRSIQATAHLPILLVAGLQPVEVEASNVLPLAKPIHRGRLRMGLAQALGLRISETLEIAHIMPEQVGPHSARILVAEDNRENAILLRHTLTGAGYLVDEVSDGEAAVAAVVANQYGLVLMDVEMPLLDGITATQRIRDWERTYGRVPTPIIAVTAHAIREVRERCQAAGMNDYMSKPLRRKRVLDATANWLDPRPLVLVADDDQSSRLVLRTWLKAEKSWRVLVVGDGQEVLDAFARYPVALIMLDMEMPVLDGYKTVEQLRKLPGGQTVPVIATTGHVGAEAERRCKLAGCTAYVAKPLAREYVLQAVRKYLEPRTQTSGFRAPTIGVRAAQVTIPSRPNAMRQAPPRLQTVVSGAPVDLMPDFIQAQRQTAASIRDALERTDFAQIARLGRNLRGVSGALGFAALVQTADEIESAALRKEQDRIARSLRQLDFLLADANETTQS